MWNQLEHLGLDFLTKTEADVRNLCSYIAHKGEPIVGYYGAPYLNLHFGDAQLILRTRLSDKEQRLEAIGLDTHAAGSSIWDVRFSGVNIARRDADRLSRRCAIQSVSDGGGLAVVTIVNADVLPSFDAGETCRLQMIAFPLRIEYFEDGEAYAAAQPERGDGEKWLLADVALLPVGLLYNRDPRRDDFDSDDDLDDLTLIRGTVKALYHGVIQFNEEAHDVFIRCVIGTEYGDLEIVHTLDEVEEAQRDAIRVGATVYGTFTLSGDAAIYAYERGVVRDEANDLAILRATFAGADPERIRSVLAEDAVYRAGYNGAVYHGRDAIVARLKTVKEEGKSRCFAHMATITSVDEGGEPLPYGAGKRCIVLAYGSEDAYDTLAFADIDAEGRIAGLVTSGESRYHFRLDDPPAPEATFPSEG